MNINFKSILENSNIMYCNVLVLRIMYSKIIWFVHTNYFDSCFLPNSLWSQQSGISVSMSYLCVWPWIFRVRCADSQYLYLIKLNYWKCKRIHFKNFVSSQCTLFHSIFLPVLHVTFHMLIRYDEELIIKALGHSFPCLLGVRVLHKKKMIRQIFQASTEGMGPHASRVKYTQKNGQPSTSYSSKYVQRVSPTHVV